MLALSTSFCCPLRRIQRESRFSTPRSATSLQARDGVTGALRLQRPFAFERLQWDLSATNLRGDRMLCPLTPPVDQQPRHERLGLRCGARHGRSDPFLGSSFTEDLLKKKH
jgi:hypothetical protein